MPLSNPTTPERDLLAVTYDKVKEIRVVDTDDQSKVLAIENLAIAGTKVTVGVDGLSGSVDGAFEDVLIQIAGKADTAQVEALDAEKLDARGLDSDALATVHAVENPEWLQVNTDDEGKVLCGRDKDGKFKELVSFEAPEFSADNIHFNNSTGQTETLDTLNIQAKLNLSDVAKKKLKDEINNNAWTGKKVAWYGTSIPAGSGNYNLPITGYAINAYLAYYGEIRRFEEGQDLPSEYPIIAGSLMGVDTMFNHCQGSSRIQRNLDGTNLGYRCLSLMNTALNNLESVFGAYNIDIVNKTFTRNLNNTVGITTWFDSAYEQTWISFVRQVLGCICQSYEIRLIARHLLGENNNSYVHSILGTYYDDVVSMLSDINKTINDFTGYLGELDLVVLEHLVNDSVNISVPVSTENIDTFAGAYSQIINEICFYKPSMRIVIVANFIDFSGTQSMNDYLKDIAVYHCTPFIDMRDYSQVSLAKQLTCGYWDANGIWHDSGFEWSEDADNDSYTTNATFPNSIRSTSLAQMKININPHQVNGVWCWESARLYQWCSDGVHPFSDKTGRLTMLIGKVLANFLNSLIKI